MVKVERVVVVVTAETKNFAFLSSLRLLLIVGSISGIGESTAVVPFDCFIIKTRTTGIVNASAVLRDMSDPVLTPSPTEPSSANLLLMLDKNCNLYHAKTPIREI